MMSMLPLYLGANVLCTYVADLENTYTDRPFASIYASNSPFSISTEGITLDSTFVIVPSMLKHQLRTMSKTLHLLIEPASSLSLQHPQLSLILSGSYINLQKQIQDFVNIYPSFPEHLAVIGKEIDHSISSPPAHLDPRITAVLSYINTQRDSSLSIENLANITRLSKSRFQHLFKEQLAISPSHYLQWHKIKVALSYISQGQSLTEAAYQANFSHLAHFSRVFSRMFGVAPSKFLSLS